MITTRYVSLWASSIVLSSFRGNIFSKLKCYCYPCLRGLKQNVYGSPLGIFLHSKFDKMCLFYWFFPFFPKSSFPSFNCFHNYTFPFIYLFLVGLLHFVCSNSFFNNFLVGVPINIILLSI